MNAEAAQPTATTPPTQTQGRGRKPSATAIRRAALHGFVQAYLEAEASNAAASALPAGARAGHRKVVVWRRDAATTAAAWRTMTAD